MSLTFVEIGKAMKETEMKQEPYSIFLGLIAVLSVFSAFGKTDGASMDLNVFFRCQHGTIG